MIFICVCVWTHLLISFSMPCTRGNYEVNANSKRQKRKKIYIGQKLSRKLNEIKVGGNGNDGDGLDHKHGLPSG